MTPNYSITRADIMAPDVYIKEREALRCEVISLKGKRRVAVGPDIMVYFENKKTLLWQIHEMIYIEKGGEEQIVDEIAAYSPLVPKGNELVVTMMIEIDDMERRRVTLAQLGHIEHSVQINFGDMIVKGVATDDAERTTAAGKTSSVHFLHFQMTPEQVQSFKNEKEITLGITHPRYSYTSVLPLAVHQEIMNDL